MKKSITYSANTYVWLDLGLAIVERAVLDYIDFYKFTHIRKNLDREKDINRKMRRNRTNKGIPPKDVAFVHSMARMRDEIPRIQQFMKSELAVTYTDGKVNLQMLMDKADEHLAEWELNNQM